MRLKITAALATAALAFTLTPAQGVSAYHMNGQGTLSLGGGGLPACAGLAGNCADADIAFSWGELTVQGAGVIQEQPVAGRYRCLSEGVVGGTGFESRIHGNTTNFQLTFNFQCQVLDGAGPEFINGWFSNVSENLGNPAYQQVPPDHLHPGPVQPGAPFFKGYFRAANTHPYAIGAGNGAAMSCLGALVPSGVDDVTNPQAILAAAFFGECTAGDA